MNGDPFWEPRRCLLEPVQEVFEAARLLDQAADAHLAGNRALAADLIGQADIPAIADWTERIWGPESLEVRRFRNIANAPRFLPKGERIKARMPSAMDRQMLIRRDSLHCRFCSIPVIDPKIRKFIRKLYTESLRWGRKNSQQHAAFQCMWLQFDHILPHSRGGDNTLENLVITCAPCNFGRMEYTLEELGLVDSRTVSIEPAPWDGLARFLVSG